jgi:D-glycero-D-manno-heptose 1,7-bisphosphate phosphatase
MRRVAVLDRDGTINVERNYLSDPAQIELVAGAAQGLRRLRELGFELIVITNQSGLGRGYFSERTLARIHERLARCLDAEGVALGAIYVCPHLPADACACRKPGTALLEQAARERGFDPREAFVIGDKACDVELGPARPCWCGRASARRRPARPGCPRITSWRTCPRPRA